MNIDKTVLWKAVKEPLRLLVLALVSWLITVIVPQLDEKYIPILTVVLKFVDQYFHELGKANGNPAMTKGLTQF